MTDLDFCLRNEGRDYVLEACTERASAYVAALPPEIPRPVTIEHGGWLPLCMALKREGYTIRIIDRSEP